jgi:oxalate decarboxylase
MVDSSRPGEARMTVFDATSKARMFNFRAGDGGFVPKTMGSARPGA